MSENGEIYTAGKNFTLLPALTALTNSTSESNHLDCENSEVRNKKRTGIGLQTSRIRNQEYILKKSEHLQRNIFVSEPGDEQSGGLRSCQKHWGEHFQFYIFSFILEKHRERLSLIFYILFLHLLVVQIN